MTEPDIDISRSWIAPPTENTPIDKCLLWVLGYDMDVTGRRPKVIEAVVNRVFLLDDLTPDEKMVMSSLAKYFLFNDSSYMPPVRQTRILHQAMERIVGKGLSSGGFDGADLTLGDRMTRVQVCHREVEMNLSYLRRSEERLGIAIRSLSHTVAFRRNPSDKTRFVKDIV